MPPSSLFVGLVKACRLLVGLGEGEGREGGRVVVIYSISAPI